VWSVVKYSRGQVERGGVSGDEGGKNDHWRTMVYITTLVDTAARVVDLPAVDCL